MSNHPLIVVEAPDARGLRAVRVRGETIGRVWSARGLRRLLRRAGVPPDDLDLDAPGRVYWEADESSWPDCPWRRWAAGALMALGLLVSAAILFLVGATDAFNALAYGGRVVGGAFIAAALAEAVAALAVCDYWGKRAIRYSGPVVLAGVGTVLVTDLMFLITQIQGRDYTPFLWLWIGLVLWVAWALWTLTRQKVWQAIQHPRGIALSVVVSGVIGLVSLTYSQMYLPYSTPVKIPFSISFGESTLSADGTALHVPAHVEFRNTGSVRVFVVGTMWTVIGWPTQYSEKGIGESDWKWETLHYDRTFRHVKYGFSRMLGTGNFADQGDRLDPGMDLSNDFVIDVPLRSGLGRIEIDATASFVRADRGKLGNSYASSREVSWDPETGRHLKDAPDWLTPKGDDFYRFHSKIYHSSEMLNLTHSTDYATGWWVFPKGRIDVAKGDTNPYLYVSIFRDSEGKERLSDSEQEPYGMTTETQSTERTVDQLLRAAKK
ncbi:hypothetical protein [Streptomyces mirabilis]|uniref:hypothetical protein n=1 Tax=Streptomyces mirabilis TaxID=68239 RepID=UPI0036793D2D